MPIPIGTRYRESIPAALAEYVDVAEADSRDPGQVVAATAGVDAVYWVDPPAELPIRWTTIAARRSPSSPRSKRIGSALVFESRTGAEKRHGAGEIDGLADTEGALDQCSAYVTHPGCGYFFTNLLFELE